MSKPIPPFGDLFQGSHYFPLFDWTWETVEQLGQANAGRLIATLRRVDKRIAVDMDRLSSQRKIMRVVHGGGLPTMAAKFDDPGGIRVATVRHDSRPIRLPIDHGSLVRAPNTTTFNRCGWCRHSEATFGCPHTDMDVSLRGICGLLRGQDDLDVDFDTPCKLEPSNAERAIALLDARIADLGRRKSEIAQGNRHLRAMKERLDWKPVLPYLGYARQFEPGRNCRVFGRRFGDPLWVPAKIWKVKDRGNARGSVWASSERHMLADKTPHNLGGYARPASHESPCILYPRDVRWLRQNATKEPSFLDLWLTKVDTKVAAKIREHFSG